MLELTQAGKQEAARLRLPRERGLKAVWSRVPAGGKAMAHLAMFVSVVGLIWQIAFGDLGIVSLLLRSHPTGAGPTEGTTVAEAPKAGSLGPMEWIWDIPIRVLADPASGGQIWEEPSIVWLDEKLEPSRAYPAKAYYWVGQPNGKKVPTSAGHWQEVQP